jgi:aspartate/methionine/tyrosine aminotransferase
MLTSPSARPAIQALRASKIREVANAGIGRADIAAFWFGEPDEVTPQFIRQAAIDALNAGDTFYTHNLGIPELRAAIAAYITRLHRPTAPDQIAVTNSGMSALMIAAQAVVDAGDHVVAVTPLWPNLVEIPKILGARVSTVALQLNPSGWQLDVQRLLDTLQPNTRAVFINSPNNPTGWTITPEAQRAILNHCRAHGIWIVADDAYERLYFANGPSSATAPAAPSFLDIADAHDRIISTNTFSKAWLMTGFRLGWIAAPLALARDLPKLIEYNTSCAPPFVQRAGLVAIEQGEPVVAHTVERLRRARDYLVGELSRTGGIEVASPSGAMYAFFRIQDLDDSLALCKRMVSEVGLGLAPGIAFGPEGEGFVRWCFAAAPERLADGVKRLRQGLATQAAHR